MLADEVPSEIRLQLLDPAITCPPIVWFATAEPAGIHDQRIVATAFRRAACVALRLPSGTRATMGR
jgi:hypothetical protein